MSLVSLDQSCTVLQGNMLFFVCLFFISFSTIKPRSAFFLIMVFYQRKTLNMHALCVHILGCLPAYSLHHQ